MNFSPLTLALGLILSSLIAAPVVAADKPLLQEGKKTLYQRVLTNPSCTLASNAGETSGTAQPAFSRFYVYQREQAAGSEWLKVGPDSFGKTVGWLPASCTVDWKMQLTLAFTNPANRDRLLFFKDRETLEHILDSGQPDAEVAPLRQALASKNSAEGILAQEPEFFIDLKDNFYLLPILSGEEVMTEEGFRTRILNVASVSKDEQESSATYTTSQLKEFSAAVVFVIDSTISMQPYIERTRQAVQDIYQRVEQENLGEQVKFGLVSFRSSLKDRPKLEYLSRMYADPNEVQDGKDFLNKIKDLKQATVSTAYWYEDPLAGVMHALDQIDWNQFGARYIVLITDASGMEGDDPLSSTGLNPDQVRIEASKPGVAIYTLHLKTPAGVKDHARAEAQYQALSTYTPTNTSLYYPVNAGDVNEFGKKVDALASAITNQVKAAYTGEDSVGSASHAQSSAEEDKLLADAKLIGHAMQLAYLGQKTGTSAPPVFEAWISDRDLVQQNIPTTDVRVLLTKSQLSDLSDTMKEILTIANEGIISPNEMFEQLRSVAATMGADPNQLNQKDNVKLAELGLMAEYLEDLPYQSEVLNLDEDTWKSMDGLAQEKFVRTLGTKLNHYRRYNQDADRWVKLSPEADSREDVYPVPLEMMP
ncbi:serine/threonine protein kinase [Thiopseudomonas alkaliphila]|uniref:vWA domain-containing protein n=1 Tax=Thiopseudomonas alkaliphila TaxID=1697053 RepID=UPI00069EA36D|nr:vWA domain-containing protein [Thiopseudomonas alkaliphila]AKX46203.1 serine/threonine protein kinase [Thiopseudomonas alkaliphila]AKX49299.1 serine/threonine protein kinase [Thiopseudomonas alkaliphila]AKX52792.1 serine/threonine protein kinase [Thiopseudomonas alkaliphila]